MKLALALTTVVLTTCLIACAAPLFSAPSDDGPTENVFLPPKRSLLQNLSKAKTLLNERRYGEAVRYLGLILDDSEDYFYRPEKNVPIYRSLKSEARRLVGQMPNRGRELYELQYGTRAKQLLKAAIESGNATKLTGVSRQFFHTQAGYEATFLLGLHQLDLARPLAGALTLAQLREECPSSDSFEPALSLATATCWLRADMPEKAEQTLVDLKSRSGKTKVRFGDNEVSLFDDKSSPIEWLTKQIGQQAPLSQTAPGQWVMPRGNPSRNASPTAGVPLLSTVWKVSTTSNPLAEGIINELTQKIVGEQRASFMPSLFPLAVNDTVLMRTAKNLMAVDFRTGKRLWETPVDDPIAKLTLTNRSSMPHYNQLANSLAQRMWHDATYGTLSSDGRLVYSVEDLSLHTAIHGSRQLVVFGRRQNVKQSDKPSNRLAAHDLRCGKLEWHIGGPADKYDIPQPDTFFLGPPLPLMGRLYVLADLLGEIRLLALDPKTGELVWSQQLAAGERDVLQSPLRRYAGLSPSHTDGILVCPTSNAAIVAIQSSTRSLLWGYQYKQNNLARQNTDRVFGQLHNPSNPTRCWNDGNPILAEGRVLVTPLDSDFLHCLNVLDGKLMWKYRRQDDLYVACVHDGKAIIVGRQHVRALQLHNTTKPRPAWNGQLIALPDGSIPSGRGYRSGNVYYLPLSTAEVFAIDLQTGKPLDTIKSRGGTIPGNLVCYNGKVISQTAEGLTVFHQLEPLKLHIADTLAHNPKDPKALALRGLVFLNADKRGEAIDCFRKSHEYAQSPRTRKLLYEMLIESLRLDFAKHRNVTQELERLIENDQQKFTLLRLMAVGLHGEHEWQSALDQYVKLIALDNANQLADVSRLETIDKRLSMCRGRCIQSNLTLLRDQASPEIAAAIDRLAQDSLDAAVKRNDNEAMRQFLSHFGGLPIGTKARDLLIARLSQPNRLLEKEWLLYEQERSTNDPIRKAIPSWPVGKVNVKTITTKIKARNNRHRLETVSYAGKTSPFFSDVAVKFNFNRNRLEAVDGCGNELWQRPLTRPTPNSPMPFPFNRSLAGINVHGHLLIFSLGPNLWAIDTLDPTAKQPLWKQDLSRQIGKNTKRPQHNPMSAALFPTQVWYNRRSSQMLGYSDFKNNSIVTTNKCIVCAGPRNVTAFDPLTGKAVWHRKFTHSRPVIFGDNQYIFVTKPNEMATVLRTSDGKKLATRTIPDHNAVLTTIGRHLLVKRRDHTLERYDPWEQTAVWKTKRIDRNAAKYMVGHDAIGFMSRDGNFSLISLSDGHAIVDTKLTSEPRLQNIMILRSGDNWHLLVCSSSTRSKLHPCPIPGTRSRQVRHGRLYGFDSEGNKLWPKAVTILDQQLPLDQPSHLPVLTFACQIYERTPKRQQRSTSVLCVDKRTGRVVYNKKLKELAQFLNLTGDPKANTVDIQLAQHRIKMTFTDEPLPPKPKAKKKPPSKPKKPNVGRSIFEALRDAAKSLIPLDITELEND